ncbi:OzmP [Actinosynnema sp. CA-299493]
MTHCRICTLRDGHPGITLDDDGVCNLCTLESADELLKNFRYTKEVFERFDAAEPRRDGGYDCLLMYSGGKDSTYVLDRFVNEQGLKVLAYTFDVPFESAQAADNVRRVRGLIDADFVLDSDHTGIKSVMREVFTSTPGKPGRYLDEKLPCVSCRTFFVIRAILCAVRHDIPYIVLCADPQQTLTMESDVREVVRGFYRTFGRALADRLFGGELEDVLFADEDALPRIVFPFVGTRYAYDPDRMIAELKAKGLYDSSPLETHCTLYPLLNLYSLRHFDCAFYKLNAASRLRAVRRNEDYDRSTYSLRFSGTADLPDVERRLKAIVLDIASGETAPGRHEEELVDIFRELHGDDVAARSVARSFLRLRETAAELDIALGHGGSR